MTKIGTGRPEKKADAAELSELLEQALKEPGVKELMDLYDSWRTLEDAARPYRQAMAVRRIISASNSSTPII